MKNAILLLTTIGALTAPAFAGDRRPTPKQTPAPAAQKVKARTVKADALKELDYGSSFGLKARATALPTVTEAETVKSVSNAAVTNVIQDRLEELEYCWLRVPAKQRVPSSAMMNFAIEASGAVAGLSIDGKLPRGVEKCLTRVAIKWTFPAADSGCEVEHALALGMKSDTVH